MRAGRVYASRFHLSKLCAIQKNHKKVSIVTNDLLYIFSFQDRRNVLLRGLSFHRSSIVRVECLVGPYIGPSSLR